MGGDILTNIELALFVSAIAIMIGSIGITVYFIRSNKGTSDSIRKTLGIAHEALDGYHVVLAKQRECEDGITSLTKKLQHALTDIGNLERVRDKQDVIIADVIEQVKTLKATIESGEKITWLAIEYMQYLLSEIKTHEIKVDGMPKILEEYIEERSRKDGED